MEFLHSRGNRARILAPDWVRELVKSNSDASTSADVFWTSDIDELQPRDDENHNFIIIADDANEERAALGSLSLASGSKAYGLFDHILPALLCGPNGFGRARTTKNLKRFAIFCVPRSGSRYLSATLSRRGLGAPQEHLREPLASVITDGNLSFAPAFAALERFGQHNGVFGTKLISTFLIKSSRNKLPKLKSNVSWMVERGYHFVYLTRPLNEAVISSYIAYRMNKWHFFGELDAQARAKLDELVFDERAAWQEYIRFRAQRIIADHVAEEFSMPVFQYSVLQDNVDEVVSLLCGRMDIDCTNLEPGKTQIPVATRGVSPTYARFTQKLDELLKRQQSEMQHMTVKELVTLTGLSKEEAGELASSSVV